MKKAIPTILLAVLLTSCSGWVIQPLPYTPPTPFLPFTQTPSIYTPTPVVIGVNSSTPAVITFTPSVTIFPSLTLTNTPPAVTLSDTPSFTPTVPPGVSPAVSVKVLGCNTSIDITHGMGEVTNAFVTLKNTGGIELTNIKVTLFARDEGREQLEEAVVLFRQAGDWRFLAQTLGILGLTVLSNGDLETAQEFLDEAYEVNKQSNNRAMEFVLTGKGILCTLRGEYEPARAFMQKNIDDLEKTGNRMGVLWGRARLGYVALHEGSVAEAHQILVDTIENFHTDGNKNGLVFALDRMSSLYVVTNKHEVATRLIGWSDATRKEIGDPRPRIEQADLDEDIAAIKAKLGVDAYETAYNLGRSLALDEAVAFTLGGK